ncbi:hypothetical protein BDV29DRAFT_182569 [Aspergillus leporis]|uniref:Uncharacterized protein n=1 Tax=Aspergillus leporis TaxID=41062 RepID=A0A5N5WQP9_9EURO|nr:hypothetical protein BDV29DRAFT_182569 [Aspergillus leporis]
MTDKGEDSLGEGSSVQGGLGIHQIHSLPVLQGVSPESIYSPAHQHQEPTQEDYVSPAVEFQRPSNYRNYYFNGYPPIALPPCQPVVRRQCCHHSVVERQFCVDRSETCDSCGRRPFLGWFYACSEDTSGFSDPIDPINGPFLSPWILKAMEDGHYTAEQREYAIHQKLDVVRMAERERGPVPPPLSMLYDPRSVVSDRNESDPWVEMVEDVSPHDSSFFDHGQPAASFAQAGQGSDIAQHPIPPPPCTFRACRHCERRYGNFEERTWVSLNEVCNDPSRPPPDSWELLNRPVSDAKLLRTMGLYPRPTRVDSLPAHGTAERRENISARLFSQENITSTNLPELVHHYLNISANSDDAERQSIEPRMSQSSGSITIGMAVPASVGEQWFSPSALRLGNEEGNTRK